VPDGRLDFRVDTGSGSTNIASISKDGNFGVGTQNPRSELQIGSLSSSDVPFTDTKNLIIADQHPQIEFEDTTVGARDYMLRVNNGSMFFMIDDNEDGSWDNPHPLKIRGNELMFAGDALYVDGNTQQVGINTTNPQHVLDVNGDIYASSDITANKSIGYYYSVVSNEVFYPASEPKYARFVSDVAGSTKAYNGNFKADEPGESVFYYNFLNTDHGRWYVVMYCDPGDIPISFASTGGWGSRGIDATHFKGQYRIGNNGLKGEFYEAAWDSTNGRVNDQGMVGYEPMITCFSPN
jgi:hypothetical protein